MRPYTAKILLLAMLVVSARSLPLDTQNSAENSDSESNESVKELVQQQESSEQQSNSDESILPETDSNESPSVESDGVIVKRSPVIPDPDLYRDKHYYEQSEAPTGSPTHDEYLEWRLRQPRYRRDTDDDDSLPLDEQDVQPLPESSLEEYAQGCEVMEENSDENNETTYDDYRRKREVSDESAAESAVSAEEEAVDGEEAEAENEETAAASSVEAASLNEEDVGVVDSAEAEAEAHSVSSDDEHNDSVSSIDLDSIASEETNES